MLEEELQTILREVADSLVAFYKLRAPVDSGALQKSIRAEVRDDGQIAIIYNRYGAYQDLGVNGLERRWGSPFSFSNSRNRFGNPNPVGGDLPWGARVNIRKFGIRPQYWASGPDGIPLINPQATQILEEELASAIEQFVATTTERTAL